MHFYLKDDRSAVQSTEVLERQCFIEGQKIGKKKQEILF